MTRLTTIILRVADLGAAVEFYRDTLGLSVSSVGPGYTFFDLGGTHLALNRAQGGDRAAQSSSTEVVLEVDDPRATFQQWRAAGVAFEVELRPVLEQDGRTMLAAHFRDPEGHLLSLTGWE